MVRARRFDASERLLHDSDSHHSRPPVGLRNLRLYGSHSIRPRRRDNYCSAGHSDNLVLAATSVTPGVASSLQHGCPRSRNLGCFTCILLGGRDRTPVRDAEAHSFTGRSAACSGAPIFPAKQLAYCSSCWIRKERLSICCMARNFLWLSLNYFSGASVAALLLPYLQDEQRAFIRVAGILLPLLLISYLTFKTALGRVEDANRHLSELNRLYLSTIETLAMAIDAKDQITHGHIRRVQQYAIGLAQRVGISDPAQIRAIEAASLLHDMGKLAVPEYILNKPGKLTPAEFEKMKLHASVGADILSAIDFPYPVVPIVRHHHENWNGTGYPDGIAGGDIPIGARILSVVDCFDALTSDRPYRPRLSDGEAIKILLERRGSMYDPLIVDTFIAAYAEIAPKADETRTAADGLATMNRDSRLAEISDAGAGLDDIAAGTEEMLMLFELATNLTGQLTFAEASEAVAKNLRRLVPASTYVFYTYDAVNDELVVEHAAGEHSGQYFGLRIPRGQRLTGWVAANRQTILNSDPVLDSWRDGAFYQTKTIQLSKHSSGA